ncbi:flagellar protein FliT [Oxalobacter sp. OttesenSCG-928-P03]|nr:flagellar protein FliT [Oxalobacter sp. OttesenSCG-928-P03]
MDKNTILTVYDKVSGVMGLMVLAAEASDWDRLTELQPQCKAYVDTLRISDHHEGLTDEEIEHKMFLIRKILDDDRRIRELTEPWMKQLADLLGHSVTSRKVNQAYGLNAVS